ncbi:hypothetical protein [Actinomyces sp. MRS3W]|uniref:hypothetical protein n=1 Tax=Actinomyces sp. MRS3W TaxID=2800796 RepID=UPI0028FD9256|nr:hypothetical protein [Actinomyces sp. MRS3W]MDU0347391.1 hypothetical protein [Actinomyces sp. MRS3W]
MAGREQRANAITPVELRHLLEGPVSRATGMIVWTIGQRRGIEGIEPVVTGSVSIQDCRLRIQFNFQSPWHVSLTFHGNNVALRRVCVNGHDRKVPGRVHMHTYVPADGNERTVGLADFPACLPHATVEDIDFRKMFEAFAVLCNVDVGSIDWVDPPVEGVN